MNIFRTRYKIEQDRASWWHWIYYREWYCPWWTPIAGYKDIMTAYRVAREEGWL